MSIGVSDTSAQRLFSQIIDAQEIGSKTVKGIKEPLRLIQMCHPLGWLAPWMIRSDEYSVFLTGKRLWDVSYIADSKAIEGVTPIVSSKLSESQKHPSYSEYELYDEEDSTPAIKYLISKHALNSMLDIDGNEVSVKPIKGFYGLSSPLAAGEPLPMAREDLIVAIELNRMICNFNSKKVLDRARDKMKALDLDSLNI